MPSKITDKERYPVERCVMPKDLYARWRTRCKQLDLPRSRVMRILAELCIDGVITDKLIKDRSGRKNS